MPFCKIDPAYTSQMGKVSVHEKKYGISIHQAAAYTIGLVGLGLYEKLVPDSWMLNLLKTKEGVSPEFSQETYKEYLGKDHKYIFRYSKTFSSTESIPYEVLEEESDQV